MTTPAEFKGERIMPLPDLHQTIQTAAERIQDYWRNRLPATVNQFLQDLQAEDKQALRDEYFEILPTEPRTLRGRPSNQPVWWIGRAPASIRAASAEMSSRNFPMFTVYRETAVDDGEHFIDAVRENRFQFVRVYIMPLDWLEEKLFENGPVKVEVSDAARRALVDNIFRHAVAHELMHVIAHFDWAEQHTVVIDWPKVVQDLVAETVTEGIPEVLTRLARGVPIQDRFPMHDDGYGYPTLTIYVQTVRPQTFTHDVGVPTMEHFMTGSYFQGRHMGGLTDWESAQRTLWQNLFVAILNPRTE